MSWSLVDGVAIPDAVGGDPALDFCNTRAGWGAPEPKEYLGSWRSLVVWTREAGLIPADDATRLLDADVRAAADLRPRQEREQERTRATGLREAAYACLVAATDARTATAWGVVSREASAAHGRGVLAPAEGGARWRRLPGDADPTLVVDAIAVAVEGLLRSPLAGCVAACPGDGCGWLFADPRRRRRWCSMAVCGNRAKARRHAARTARPLLADHAPAPP